ncbi:hypothetical protein P3T23_002333 [Paraburkholderia sp. GAS448]
MTGKVDMAQFERVARRWIWSRRQLQALLGLRSGMSTFTGNANNSTFPPPRRYTVRTLYQVGQTRHVSERRGTEMISCETPLAEWASHAGHASKKTLPDRRIVQPPGGHVGTTK